MCRNSKQVQLDYEKQYQNSQKWMKRALIAMSLLDGDELPESTLKEWKKEYDWVYGHFEDHNKGD